MKRKIYSLGIALAFSMAPFPSNAQELSQADIDSYVEAIPGWYSSYQRSKESRDAALENFTTILNSNEAQKFKKVANADEFDKMLQRIKSAGSSNSTVCRSQLSDMPQAQTLFCVSSFDQRNRNFQSYFQNTIRPLKQAQNAYGFHQGMAVVDFDMVQNGCQKLDGLAQYQTVAEPCDEVLGRNTPAPIVLDEVEAE